MARDREQYNAYMREWNQKNPHADKRQKLKKFGLTLDSYYRMLAEQGYVCALCGKPESKINGKTGTPFALAIDHCHATGTVRGLLCMKCNRGLGFFEDNVVVLQKAMRYLSPERNSSQGN